jgi:hypothetical protein
MNDTSFAEMYPLYIFFLVLAGIFLLIFKGFAVGSKWKVLKYDFPDQSHSKSFSTAKNVVRKTGTVVHTGKGGMKVTFTNVGLRITSWNPFESAIIIPYDKLKIEKILKLRHEVFIYIKVLHEVDFQIYFPDKTRFLIEKYIGSLDQVEVIEKHVELDIGIG